MPRLVASSTMLPLSSSSGSSGISSSFTSQCQLPLGSSSKPCVSTPLLALAVSLSRPCAVVAQACRVLRRPRLHMTTWRVLQTAHQSYFSSRVPLPLQLVYWRCNCCLNWSFSLSGLTLRSELSRCGTTVCLVRFWRWFSSY